MENSIIPFTMKLFKRLDYFKNSKTLKFLHNIELICSETFQARNNKKINSINGMYVTGLGIKKLQGNEWLDDEVVNFYFQLIKNESNFAIYSVDALNYTNFKKYQRINEIYKVRQSRASTKHLDFIFIPINFDRLHWAFAVVHVNKKINKFYDSLKNMGKQINGHCVCEDIRQFLTTTNFICDVDEFGWQFEYPYTPQQNDKSSCGVYTCQLAKQISRSQELKLSATDIPHLRKEMVVEVVSGYLFQ